jgi:hypothetical protein
MTTMFPAHATFVATGPDFQPTVIDAGFRSEQAIAALLHEHKPERVHLYVQEALDGGLRLLTPGTEFTGRDDIAQYHVTTYTDAMTGQTLKVGWDS